MRTSRDEIRQFVVGELQTNCYAYVSEGSCLLVDPGASGTRIAEALADVHLELVVCTHRHHDHVGGVRAVVELLGAPWAIGEHDAELAVRALELSRHIIDHEEDEIADPPAPDRILHEGDVLEVGTACFRVLNTPGHTPGGIVLVGEGTAEGVAFTGDTLFAGSCGRTDFIGGDARAMRASLARLTQELAPETTLYCGHGLHTTMAYELAHNPWLLEL